MKEGKETKNLDEILDPFDINQNERGNSDDVPPSRERPFWDTKNNRQHDRQEIEE